MTLKTIRIELARTPGRPDGDPGHAYEFRAPLNESGFLDRFAWPAARTLCTVHRFSEGREAEQGLLVLSRGGHWAFSYAPGTDDDEGLFKLGHHKIQVGQYLTVAEHDGQARTFRVVSVNDWHPAAGARAVH